MKLDFVRNTKRNLLAGGVASVAGMVLQFVNRTLFLWLMGPEYLGLNGLFASVLGVLSLAELGFSSAVVYAMYKPIAEDDHELLCAYLKFFRDVYRWIGTAILVLGLCLLPFVPRLVHGGVPEGLDLRLLYLIHLANTAASYFLFAYRGSILHAYHRGDLLVNMTTAMKFAQYFTVMAILLLTRNYYHYVLATVAFTVISNFLILRLVRRHFPDLVPRGRLAEWRRKAVVADVKAIFMHKVGGTITGSSDNLLISWALGLVAVATYGNYFYVMSAVAGFVGVLNGATTAGFGNKIHTESRETTFRLFMKANRMMMIATLWSAGVMTALYQPFIEVWTRNDPAMMRHFQTPVLMVVFFFVNMSRQMLLSVKTAAGLWTHDRWKPIVAGVANLAISIALVEWLPEEWKLDGVITGTIASILLIQIPWETHVLFTEVFSVEQKHRYWLEQTGFAGLAVWLCGGAWLAGNAVVAEGPVGFVLKGVAAAGCATAVLLLLFRQDCLDLLGVLRRK